MIDYHAMIDYRHRYDASATSLMWLSDAERTAELARQEAAEEAERRERELAKKNVVSFDFAGRKVIGRGGGGGGGVAGALGGFQESSQAVAAAEQQAAQSWQEAATASEAAAAAAAGAAGDAGAVHHSAFANPFLRGPRPNYLGGGGAQRTGGSGQAGPEVASSGGGGRAARSSRGRVQQDDGVCAAAWAAGDVDHAPGPVDDGDDEDHGSGAAGAAAAVRHRATPSVSGPVVISGGSTAIGGGGGGGGGAAAAVAGGFRARPGEADRSVACLSMHQPWAGLLVAGIKAVEGRSWPTDHRGRLWIASTAQPLDPADEAELRAAHEQRVRRGEMLPLPWPAHFPSSALLGCVEVVDVIEQSEYRRRAEAGLLPDEGNDSAYLFVCESPRALLAPLRVSGQHKIWALTHQTARTARRGLLDPPPPLAAAAAAAGRPSRHVHAPGDVSQAGHGNKQQAEAAGASAMVGTDTHPGTGSVVGARDLRDLRVVDLHPHSHLWPQPQPQPPAAAAAAAGLAVRVLRPGLVVVKGFLSPSEQQALVDTTRELGLGEGGFYRPSYGNRGKQQLFVRHAISAIAPQEAPAQRGGKGRGRGGSRKRSSYA
jgi:hypothetical protein